MRGLSSVSARRLRAGLFRSAGVGHVGRPVAESQSESGAAGPAPQHGGLPRVLQSADNMLSNFESAVELTPVTDLPSESPWGSTREPSAVDPAAAAATAASAAAAPAVIQGLRDIRSQAWPRGPLDVHGKHAFDCCTMCVYRTVFPNKLFGHCRSGGAVATTVAAGDGRGAVARCCRRRCRCACVCINSWKP